MPQARLRASKTSTRCRDIPEIAITYRAIATLKPDPKNARKHSDRQLRELKGLKAFRLNVPVPMDSSGRIMDGRSRVLFCKQLAIKSRLDDGNS